MSDLILSVGVDTKPAEEQLKKFSDIAKNAVKFSPGDGGSARLLLQQMDGYTASIQKASAALKGLSDFFSSFSAGAGNYSREAIRSIGSVAEAYRMSTSQLLATERNLNSSRIADAKRADQELLRNRIALNKQMADELKKAAPTGSLASGVTASQRNSALDALFPSAADVEKRTAQLRSQFSKGMASGSLSNDVTSSQRTSALDALFPSEAQAFERGKKFREQFAKGAATGQVGTQSGTLGTFVESLVEGGTGNRSAISAFYSNMEKQAQAAADRTSQIIENAITRQSNTLATASRAVTSFSGRVDRNISAGGDADPGMIRQAKAAYDELFSVLGKGATTTATSNAAYNKFRGTMLGLAEDFRKVNGTLDDTNRRFGSLAFGGQSLTRFVENTRVALSGLAGVLGFREVLQSVVALQQIRTGFEAVTGSAAKGKEEFAFAASLAEKYGVSLEGTAQSLIKFTAASKESGFSTNQVRTIFENTAAAGRALNLSGDDMFGIFNALQQMMSKGKVQAEELRGQLGDRLPGAFNIMAKALNVTTGELDSMLKKGQIGSDVLLRFSETLKQSFAGNLSEAVTSLPAELARLGNAFTLAMGKIGEGGFTDGMLNATRALTNFMKSPDAAEFLAKIGSAAEFVTNAFVGLLSHSNALAVVLGTFGAMKIGGLFGDMATNIGKAFRQTQEFVPAVEQAAARVTLLSRAVAATSTAASRFGAGILAAFGGPWGAAATLAAGFFTYVLTRTNETVEKSKQAGKEIAEIFARAMHDPDITSSQVKSTSDTLLEKRKQAVIDLAIAQDKLAKAQEHADKAVNAISNPGAAAGAPGAALGVVFRNFGPFNQDNVSGAQKGAAALRDQIKATTDEINQLDEKWRTTKLQEMGATLEQAGMLGVKGIEPLRAQVDELNKSGKAIPSDVIHNVDTLATTVQKLDAVPKGMDSHLQTQIDKYVQLADKVLPKASQEYEKMSDLLEPLQEKLRNYNDSITANEHKLASLNDALKSARSQGDTASEVRISQEILDTQGKITASHVATNEVLQQRGRIVLAFGEIQRAEERAQQKRQADLSQELLTLEARNRAVEQGATAVAQLDRQDAIVAAQKKVVDAFYDPKTKEFHDTTQMLEELQRAAKDAGKAFDLKTLNDFLGQIDLVIEKGTVATKTQSEWNHATAVLPGLLEKLGMDSSQVAQIMGQLKEHIDPVTASIAAMSKEINGLHFAPGVQQDFANTLQSLVAGISGGNLDKLVSGAEKGGLSDKNVLDLTQGKIQSVADLMKILSATSADYTAKLGAQSKATEIEAELQDKLSTAAGGSAVQQAEAARAVEAAKKAFELNKPELAQAILSTGDLGKVLLESGVPALVAFGKALDHLDAAKFNGQINSMVRDAERAVQTFGMNKVQKMGVDVADKGASVDVQNYYTTLGQLERAEDQYKEGYKKRSAEVMKASDDLVHKLFENAAKQKLALQGPFTPEMLQRSLDDARKQADAVLKTTRANTTQDQPKQSTEDKVAKNFENAKARLVQIVDGFTSAGEAAERYYQTLNVAGGKYTAQQASELAGLKNLANATKALEQSSGKMQSTVSSLERSSADNSRVAGLMRANDAISADIKNIQAYGDALEKSALSDDEKAKALAALAVEQDKVAKAQGDYAAAQDFYIKKTEGEAQDITARTQLFKLETLGTDQSRAAYAALTAQHQAYQIEAERSATLGALNAQIEKLQADNTKDHTAEIAKLNAMKTATNDLFDAQKAEQAAKDARKVLDNELASPAGKAFKQLTDGMESNWKESLRNMFSTGKFDYKNFFDGMKDSFIEMLAEMAYQALIKPIVVPIIQQAGSSLFGLSDNAVGSITGSSFSSGGAGAGGGGTNMFSNLLSGSNNAFKGAQSLGLIGGAAAPTLAPGVAMAADGTLYSAATGSVLMSSSGGLGEGVAMAANGTLYNGATGEVLASGVGQSSALMGTIGSGLGFAAGGMMIGSLLGGPLTSAFGKRDVGQGMIGGTLGGVAGGFAGGALLGTQLGAFAGPVGMIAGAILGTVAASLFGPHPSVGPGGGAGFDLTGVRYKGGDNGFDPQPYVDSANQTIKDIKTFISSIGGTINPNNPNGFINDRGALDTTYNVNYKGAGVPFQVGFTDTSEADRIHVGSSDQQMQIAELLAFKNLDVQGLSENVVKQFRDIDPMTTTLDQFQKNVGIAQLYDQTVNFQKAAPAAADSLKQITDNVDAFKKQLDDAGVEMTKLGLDVDKFNKAVTDQFNDQIQTGITQIMDPMKAARDAETELANYRVELAKKVGADMSKVVQLNALEMQQVMAQQTSSLTQLRDQLLGSDSVPLADRFAAAQKKFLGTVNDLNNGVLDNDASTTIGDFVDLSKQMYGSAQQFQDSFNEALSVINAALDPATYAGGSNPQATNQALVVNTQETADGVDHLNEQITTLVQQNAQLTQAIQRLLSKVAGA